MSDDPSDLSEDAHRFVVDDGITRATVSFRDGERSAIAYPVDVAEAVVRLAEAVERLTPHAPTTPDIPRTMSDDPRVTVPAELVDELADLFYHWDNASENGIPFDVQRFVPAARALVDAAERPDEGCEIHKICGCPPPAPVPEPLCRCGHDRLEHWDGRLQCFDGLLSHCAEFTPAPPPVPVSDEAEAEEAWDGTTAAEDSEVVNAILPQMRALLAAEMLTIVERIAKRHFKAGFRAARQAGKDEQPMSEPDEAAITRLLGEHAPSYQVDGDYCEIQWVECICGSEYFVDTDAGYPEHNAHVAAVLAAHMADREADAAAKVQAVQSVIDKANALSPDQFKTGQGHLSPAFREVNWRAVAEALAGTLNEIERIALDRAARLTPDTEGETDE